MLWNVSRRNVVSIVCYLTQCVQSQRLDVECNIVAVEYGSLHFWYVGTDRGLIYN